MYKNYIKRLLDIIISIFGLLFFVFIYIFLLIFSINKKNIIFKQKRTGYKGKEFYIYKFRTIKNDKVTIIGKFLRFTSLDEVPQFINIIKGEMSLIGPRPWIPDYFILFDKNDLKRLDVKPGIIGLAQVNGRNKINIKKKIEYDIFYVNNISFFLDLIILFKSFKVLFVKEDYDNIDKNIKKELKELEKIKRVKSMNKKGFTLIELLAVIIILGILMIIAIPSVTKYISDSRKNAYIDTAKEIIGGARNIVNEGKLGMYDTDTTYYLPVSCIKTENSSKSPYGEFTKAYVVVTYDGKGYTYYWTSVDDAGQGIKSIKKIDELDIDDISSDLKDDDIKNTIGIGGRTKVGVFNDCKTETKADAERDYVCKRADPSTLHTEECVAGINGTQLLYYCYGAGYVNTATGKGSTITFGNEEITPGSLVAGDPFDCDVNGDGVYDPEEERFYYVSPYFDTIASANSTNVFDYNYAVLIKSNDMKKVSGEVGYYSIDENWHGPVEAIKNLPTTSEWTNVRLKNTTRRILAEGRNNSNHNKTSTNGGILPEAFSYEGYAARLMTLQEAKYGCNETSNPLDKCMFFLENTRFSDETATNNYGSYFETVDYNSTYAAFGPRSYHRDYSANNVYPHGTNYVRPTIELPLSDIDY